MSVSVIKLRLGRCWQKSWHDWFEDSGKNSLPACRDLLDQEIALIRRVAAWLRGCTASVVQSLGFQWETLEFKSNRRPAAFWFSC